MKPLLYLCLLSLLSTNLVAQNNLPFTGCGTDILRKQHPDLQAIQDQFDLAASNTANGSRGNIAPAEKGQVVRTLPVVVHIIHNGGAENISDAQVQQGIDQLNAAFSAQFGTGVNTEVQFCLAQRSPQNLTTNGVTRDVSALTVFDMDAQDLAVKDLNRWSPTCYINIWLVAAINSSSSGNGVVGYAYFPSSHGTAVDGIVMEAAYFGSSQSNTSVFVHEMGHYLGLYHTFEGGCPNGNCLLEGDRVCDTPPDQTTFSSCFPNANSCGTDADDATSNNPFTADVPDLGEDYMDYSDLSCYTKFTQGQSDRMNWHITNVRSSLLDCPSCQTPCPAPITAQITTPATNPVTILVGTTLNFVATAANATQYEWRIGANAPFSTTLNAAQTFNVAGDYWVIFQASGSNPALCLDAFDSIRVVVKCDAQAAFTASNTHPELGIPVVLTNNSTNATSYQWLVDGVLSSTLANYTHTFNAAGIFSVALIAQNGFCSDTVVQSFFVGCKDERKRANNWYFGNQAGISFATGSPVALTNSAMATSEGVSTMSDLDGNLLFYSDGNRIWNRNHLLMANGSGLLGSGISAQSSIIVPMPGNADRYYIFTVPNWTDNHAELAYSIVDMTLNAGLGDIVAGMKNIVLNTNVSEQLTAAYHANCEDIWIISHEKNNNKYVAYLLGSTGVNPVAVVSATGNDYVAANRYGGLRVSHAGKKICSTLGGNAPDNITVVLSDFNASTGVVSNSITLETAGTMHNAYSSEFSSDDKMLYVVEFNSSLLKQYSIAGPITSQTITTFGTMVNVLQMGPDGMIYIGGSGSTALSVIQFPNLFGGVCGFLPSAVSLSNRVCRIGLPNFFPNYFQPALDISAVNTICQSESTLIHLSSNQCNASYIWTVPTENGTITVLSDTLVQFTSNGSSGLATVKVVRTTPCGIDSISHDINVNICGICQVLDLSAGQDTAICTGRSVQLQATSGFEDYHWTPITGLDDPNIEDPIATPATTTTYALDATILGNNLIVNADFAQGNTGFTSDYLFSFYTPCQYTVSSGLWIYTALDHTPTSDNMMMSLDGCGTPNKVVWRQTIPVVPNTDYLFSLWMTRADVAQPTLRVTFNNIFQTNFVGIPYSLPNPPAVWDEYVYPWNSGSDNSVTIELTNLELGLNGNDFALDDITLRTICHYLDTVTVKVYNATAPVLELGPDVVACANAVRTFDAGPNFEHYEWQNGQTDRTFTAFTAGKYWVTVRDSCGGIQSDTIRVTLAPTPSLDLGADQLLCAGDSLQLVFASNGVFGTYNWTPATALNCANCATPWAKPTTTTVFHFAATTANGCTNADSIKVNIRPVASSTQSIEQCNSFIYNGHVYTATGLYQDTLQTTFGCDSIITTDLTISPGFSSISSPVICLGESVQVGSNIYATTGVFVDTFQSLNGCDSVITTNLTVVPEFMVSNSPVICSGESLQVGSNTYSASGMYVDVLQSVGGCDSTITTNLTVLPALSSSSSASICAGESLQIGSNIYYVSGMYIDVLQSIGGCDSTITTNLTVLPALSSSSSASICAGESLQIGSNTYSASGMYVDVLQSIGGCDSTVTTNLTVLPAIGSNTSSVICAGESLQIGSNTYAASGMYVDVLQSIGGCDSTVTTNLTVLSAIGSNANSVICAGESLQIGSNTYAASGMYVDVLQSIGGCDSTVTTNLTVLPAIGSNTSSVICAGESLQIGSNTYAASGMYVDVLQSIGGCDSTITTNLTVLPILSSSSNQVICAGESIQVGTNHYTVSGMYLDVLQSVDGCDSTLTTNLEVLDTVLYFQEFVWCEGDSIQVGNKYYVQPGVFRDVFTSLSTCDSTIVTKIVKGEAAYCDSVDCRIFVPNAFLPNSDGLNAYFEAYSPVTKIIEMLIYDRWGELIYQSNSTEPKWDGNFRGKAAPNGVYVYLLKCACAGGKLFFKTGEVTLFR